MSLAGILIEDSPTIRESLIPALAELAGVEVIAVAETAAEGIAALQMHADRWRIAVIDMFLRQGNGLEILKSIRRRHANQRVIVLTNYATHTIRHRSLEAGADAVFDKSTEIDAFFELCIAYSSAHPDSE